MKALAGLLVFLAICNPLRGDEPLRVMTWNIRYNNRGDGENAWPKRKDWVAEIIAGQKLDIAGFQEVLVDQLEDLKTRLPEFDSYGVGRDDGKAAGEFTPILFNKKRFELLDNDTFWLSTTPEVVASKSWDAAITRIASWVKLKERVTGQVFYAINTHFDHLGKRAREESAKLIIRQWKERFGTHPVVLLGDFNSTPDTSAYQTMIAVSEPNAPSLRDARECSQSKATGPNSTWNGFYAIVPNQRIDFIFVSPELEVLAHQTLDEQRDGRFPSDHLPVVAELQLAKPN